MDERKHTSLRAMALIEAMGMVKDSLAVDLPSKSLASVILAEFAPAVGQTINKFNLHV